MKRTFVACVVLASASTSIMAEAYLVKASGKSCVPGLYSQPAGGPFSVFLFCDDAAGSNIGVVNTEGAAGPGRIELPPPKTWDKWSVNNRFWQDAEWATDITSFAWSPDLRALYVATSEVYGTGSLYKLDLVKRTFARLIPNSGERRDSGLGYSAEINGINLRTGEVSAAVSISSEAPRKTEVKTIVVK